MVSPTLSNIYLDKLDEFIEQELIPQYTRGEVRAANPAYRQADALLRRARRRGDRAEARHLALEMRTLPSTDPMDPGYRRLRYIRYADLCRHRHKSAYADLRIMPHCHLAGRVCAAHESSGCPPSRHNPDAPSRLPPGATHMPILAQTAFSPVSRVLRGPLRVGAPDRYACGSSSRCSDYADIRAAFRASASRFRPQAGIIPESA